MTFLNPVVLMGLIAASIPILIHLLNLRKLKKIDFSTLSFLKELQKNKIRKIKLKQWLLLAMRVMIIIFLVLAFSRPALRGTSIGGAASSAKTTAIYIIDDTYSMSVIGAKGSYLNFAKENVKHLLEELQEGDEAAVILLSRSDEKIKMTSNISDLIKNVGNIQISYATGYINNAIVKSAELISQSKNFNKEIYLFSDFQENRLAAANSTSDLSEILNENVKLYGFDFSGKPVYNIAITDLKLQSQILEKDKPITFDVTISNSSEKDVEDAVVSLFTNGERSAQKSVDIKSGTAVTVSIEANLKSSGFMEFSAEIEDDEITQDNRRYYCVYVPAAIPVGLFFQNEEDSRFLRIALEIAGENNPLKITGQNVSQLSSRNLSLYNTVIFISSGEIDNAERLKEFVRNGGGLLLFPSVGSTPETFNTSLTSLGLPSGLGYSGKKGGITSANRFSKVDTDHPVFQNLFVDEKKKIESPDIYYNIKLYPSDKGRDLITASDGASFMSEYSFGNGKIIVFSSALDPSWSNFPLKGIFAPLMHKTVLYLSHNQVNEENNYAGYPISINMKDRAVPQVNIKRPDGTSESIKTAGEDYLSYTKTEMAGIYSISNGETFNKIPVNTDPAESVIRYISNNDFKDYLNQINFKGKFINIDVSGNPSNEIQQARFGSELWKIFAVLTLLLALAEMTVARSVKRDLAVVK